MMNGGKIMDKPLVTIEYKTANGSRICVEVSTSVKELLEQSDRQIRSQRRQDRRYLDREDFIDGLTDTAMRYPQQADAADLVIRMESYKRLYAAVNKLSEKQSRRLLLHFEDNLTHRQIANIEGVNRATVSRSIEAALKQLQKYLVD
jgi:RNA polymerase sigma factor (sigma-70 family)